MIWLLHTTWTSITTCLHSYQWGGTCVRLPYEESSIKMGNTQEVNVNKGVLDRVEARQDGAASTKQIKKYCLALSRFSNVLNPSRFVQIRLYRIVLSLFENCL